jgi:hypothetical protein
LQDIASSCSRGGHRCRGFGGIDRDADELRSGVGQRLDLCDGRADVRGIGVGHRLHDDRRAAADLDAAHKRDPRPTAGDGRSIQWAHCDLGLGMFCIVRRRGPRGAGAM